VRSLLGGSEPVDAAFLRKSPTDHTRIERLVPRRVGAHSGKSVAHSGESKTKVRGEIGPLTHKGSFNALPSPLLGGRESKVHMPVRRSSLLGALAMA
jgi:hypothetical protein